MRDVAAAVFGLVLAGGLQPAAGADPAASRNRHVPPLYESTCAEVHEREDAANARVYSVFLQNGGSIRMAFRPAASCPALDVSARDGAGRAFTHVVPTDCALVAVASTRDTAACADVFYGSMSRKDRRERWKGARFSLDPVRTEGYSIKPLNEHRHVQITVNGPGTEVLLSFTNPECNPGTVFRADGTRSDSPTVVLFQPPPRAGYCGEASVASRRLSGAEAARAATASAGPSGGSPTGR